MMYNQDYIICQAAEEDFTTIKAYIKTFALDDRDLSHSQFIVAKNKKQIIGFGRIKNMDSCCELCSLGIIETHRLNGIGKTLVQHLISISNKPVYLVCIIPEFFIPLGFIVVKDYPAPINEKLHYCVNSLTVKEPYVVMKFEKQHT